MARLARKELADLRAMEEEHARMELHGSGKHFYGAGATPSMGLSQFRGGAKKCVSYDDDEMEGAGRFQFRLPGLGSLGRLGRSGRAPVAPRVPRGPAPGYGPGAIVPRPTGGPIVPAGTRPGVLPATPSMPRSWYQNLGRTGRTGAPASAASRATLLSRLRSGVTAQRLAAAASLGIPLSMLGAYLADQGAANDGGFYDDYAGTEMAPGPGAGEDGPIVDPGLPAGPEAPLPGDYGDLVDTNGDGIPDSMAPGGLSRAEYNYLLSGAVETRRRGKKGAGQLHITHGGAKSGARSARAAIVKKVMAERGVSLPQASRIVKEEGLY